MSLFCAGARKSSPTAADHHSTSFISPMFNETPSYTCDMWFEKSLHSKEISDQLYFFLSSLSRITYETWTSQNTYAQRSHNSQCKNLLLLCLSRSIEVESQMFIDRSWKQARYECFHFCKIIILLFHKKGNPFSWLRLSHVYCDTCTRVRGADIKHNSLHVVTFARQHGSIKSQQHFFHFLCVPTNCTVSVVVVYDQAPRITWWPPSAQHLHIHTRPVFHCGWSRRRSPTRSLSQNLISRGPESMSL